MTESSQVTDDDLKTAIEDAGLGPARDVQMVEHDGFVIMKVELDPESPRKARALRRWADRIEICDAISGRYSKRDPYTRLHVRGTYGDGQLIIITCLFARQAEVRQVATVAEHIRHDPQVLIDALIANELITTNAPRS